jgi:peptide/nickel transport system permease protein
MIRYVARRLLYAVPILVGISFVAFFLIHLIPGDPIAAMLGDRYSESAGRVLREQFGLDQPLPSQYLSFLAKAVQLDFGQSIQQRTDVRSLILSRMGVTFLLVLYALSVAFVLAVPLAIWSAVRANRLPDHVVRVSMMVAFAMPSFWLGLLLILFFSLQLGWFPTSGLAPPVLPLIWSLTLPAVTLGLSLSPVFTRTLRSSLIENLNADHVMAARARGLSDARVMFRYVMRPSLIALVTLIGFFAGALLSGSVVVETVFAIPGVGSLLLNAVLLRDFPVIEALALLFGVVTVVCILITDVANAALDPRIRL